MGKFLEALKELSDLSNKLVQGPDQGMTLAELQDYHELRRADKRAEMEILMENEKDPLIKKKLESRWFDGIYKWDDLYENKK